MKVGVTGGQGFIGSYVVDALEARGHHAVIFDRRNLGTDREFILGDVTDPIATMELGAHVDGVVHLAAMLGTQEWINDPKPAATVNIFGTLNVLEACRSNRIPMANITVGNWQMCNSYSTSKHAAERFCRQFADLGVPVNQVRAMNAYGPRQSAPKPYGSAKVRKIIPSFTCRALAGHPIEVYGDGQQVSDCVHVTDVARVLVKALEAAERGDVFDRVVEVGPAEHQNVLKVARMVKTVADDLMRMQDPDWQGSQIVHLPMRPGEEPGARVTADTTTLRLVSESPSDFRPLECGIGQTVEWFHDNRGVTWEVPT